MPVAWRARITLTPKVFAVLRHLVDHPGRLVTQEELLEAIWPETYVQPEILRKYILELRKVLGDDPKSPRFIETLPKRGYRFVAALEEESFMPVRRALPVPVGRERELAGLDAHLRKALQGHRQLVLVTGEAGVGKSTLLDAFEQRLGGHEGHAHRARAVRRRFWRQGSLLSDPGCVRPTGARPRSRRHHPDSGFAGADLADPVPVPAPGPSSARRLQREILGATRERMVREICEALESLTAANPLALILEDLHWVDPSTLDLISALARRRGPAKLLVLGTYRPVDVILLQSPLKALRQDLVMHKLCSEIALERLTEPDVAQYLAEEFPGELPAGLAELVHRHSEGNPLFMTAIVSDLVKSGLLARRRRIVEADRAAGADRAGRSGNAAADAGDSGGAPQRTRAARAEERQRGGTGGFRRGRWRPCSALASPKPKKPASDSPQRQQFLRPGRASGVLGATQSAHYEFRHSLYREALYRRVPPAQRSRLHRLLAEKAEDASWGQMPPWNWLPNWLCTSNRAASLSARHAT